MLILHTAYSYCIQDATSFIRGLPSSAAEAEREASRQKDRLSTVVDTTLIARNYQEISAIRARESLAMEADARAHAAEEALRGLPGDHRALLLVKPRGLAFVPTHPELLVISDSHLHQVQYYSLLIRTRCGY
jgi:hypothetical protein